MALIVIHLFFLIHVYQQLFCSGNGAWMHTMCLYSCLFPELSVFIHTTLFAVHLASNFGIPTQASCHHHHHHHQTSMFNSYTTDVCLLQEVTSILVADGVSSEKILKNFWQTRWSSYCCIIIEQQLVIYSAPPMNIISAWHKKIKPILGFLSMCGLWRSCCSSNSNLYWRYTSHAMDLSPLPEERTTWEWDGEQ
jgi:hypothetical protein